MKSKILVTNIRTSDVINESCYNIKSQSFILTENKRKPLSKKQKANFLRVVLEDVLKTPIKSFSVKQKRKLR